MLKGFWTDASIDNPEFTYSSDNPHKKIDYIMYRPAKNWKVVENRVICDKVASDHCALLSILKLIKEFLPKFSIRITQKEISDMAIS